MTSVLAVTPADGEVLDALQRRQGDGMTRDGGADHEVAGVAKSGEKGVEVLAGNDHRRVGHDLIDATGSPPCQ